MKLRYLQIASSICITCCHLGMSHPALASQTYSKMLTKEYVVTKKNVNGTIVDKDGNPLIGVTIFEKGYRHGCITDSTANTSSRYPIGMLSLSSPTLDTRHRN